MVEVEFRDLFFPWLDNNNNSIPQGQQQQQQQHNIDSLGEIVGAVPGWGAQLLHSARFAHSHTYIKSLADIHGYTIVSRRNETLRLECTQPQPGIFYILQKINTK